LEFKYCLPQYLKCGIIQSTDQFDLKNAFSGFSPLLKKLRNTFYNIIMPIDYYGQSASNKIYENLTSNKPAAICRFGRIEIASMKEIDLINKGKSKYYKDKFKALESNAGFFPIKENNIKKFYLRMKEDIRYVDILGQWCPEELYFKDELKNIKKIPLEDIEPFNHKSPWTRALKRKKVLVITPYSNTIIKQYKKRKLLFKNKDILPKFKLLTLTSVNSVGGENEGFESWFEALKYMENKISKIDFDIAILGCGAYGLPLAAHIKRIGKKAVHMGGSTQLLFGIKGKRWEESHLNLINKHWVRPASNERPKNYKKIESGCYW